MHTRSSAQAMGVRGLYLRWYHGRCPPRRWWRWEARCHVCHAQSPWRHGEPTHTHTKQERRQYWFTKENKYPVWDRCWSLGEIFNKFDIRTVCLLTYDDNKDNKDHWQPYWQENCLFGICIVWWDHLNFRSISYRALCLISDVMGVAIKVLKNKFWSKVLGHSCGAQEAFSLPARCSWPVSRGSAPSSSSACPHWGTCHSWAPE